jgi:hypothetical protein
MRVASHGLKHRQLVQHWVEHRVAHEALSQSNTTTDISLIPMM